MHSIALALTKDVHAAVIGVVHVVLDHVFGTAADVSDAAAKIGAIGFGCVGDEIVGSTATVAPDVAEVEPVSDFVRRGPSQVVGTRSWAINAYKLVSAYDAVGGRVATWELRIPQESAAQVANPKVHVVLRWPSI